MDFDYQEWEKYYYRLRDDYQSRRKFSQQVSVHDLKDMNDRAIGLDKALSVMKGSPMQYELSSSELARRQVILENLRKLIVSRLCLSHLAPNTAVTILYSAMP